MKPTSSSTGKTSGPIQDTPKFSHGIKTATIPLIFHMASYADSALATPLPAHMNFIPHQYPPPHTTPLQHAYATTDPALRSSADQSLVDGLKKNNGGDGKPRLRKACDSCSIRKVKCDESGPPCKACVALDIPCKFERQSKRRGPPNKHAESVKKQRFDSSVEASGHSVPSSPTHAAHTLASIAQHQVLSAESICPWPVIQLLVDDYFTLVHPLVPVPHEPSFRAALHQRQDMGNQMFLALLASMVGCLAAGYPQRPRERLQAHNLKNLFPSHMGLVERCHKVSLEAQNPITYNREFTVHDAITNYLQGLTSEFTCNRPASLLYFKQCLAIVTNLGLHRDSAATSSSGAPPSRMTPNGQILRGPPQPGEDLLTQELERRLFWSLFVSARTMNQLGVPPSELHIPAATNSAPYPPLPIEVDDAYLTSTIVLPQPEDSVSEIVGFNANVRIFRTYDTLSKAESIYGVDEIYNWEQQKAVLERSLDNIKWSLENLPLCLHLGQEDRSANAAQNGHASPSPITLQSLNMGTQINSIFGTTGRSVIQQAIQKTHIHANQIGTRSYLIQKYFRLSAAQQNSTSISIPSPIIDTLSLNNNNATSHSINDTRVVDERHAAIDDFHSYLKKTPESSLQASGVNHVRHLRQILSTLLAGSTLEGNDPFSPPNSDAEVLQEISSMLAHLETALGKSVGLDDENQGSRLLA